MHILCVLQTIGCAVIMSTIWYTVMRICINIEKDFILVEHFHQQFLLTSSLISCMIMFYIRSHISLDAQCNFSMTYN